ncbi:GAF domain-containing protein, partial [bacterium]|nr:GAF domain-containing protein [bacterium]
DNVIELIAEKVRSLHPEAMEMLKTASCIGNQFDLKTLAIATGRTEKDVIRLLKQPVKADLIKPVEIGWQYPFNLIDYDNQPNQESDKSYQFTHSRVSRATYSLLNAIEKKTCHLMLGRILKESTPDEQIANNTYKIVNHMNQGLRLIEKQSERHELARLNLIAGIKSKSTAAVETAWKFFSLGSELLSENSWEDDYDLTKELYLRRSECEYFIGNTDAAEPIFDLLFQHLKTSKEKAGVYTLKLNLYIKNNRLEEAIKIGIEALQILFGEKIPPNDAEITIISQVKMQDNQAVLERKGIENILFLPVMTSSEKKAVMDLITSIIPAAYLVKRNLWILLTLKMVEISLEYGNTDSSAFGYMNLAVILCSGLQDYDNGYAMGCLALDLNNKFNNNGLISQLNFLFGSYIGHWKNEARENLAYLRRSYQAGIEQGDLISAGLSVDFLMKTHIIVGSPLEEIQKEAKKHQDFVEQLHNPDLKNILEISKLMIVLRDSEPDSRDFIPDLDKTEKLIDSIKESKNSQLLHWYYLINAQIHYFFYNKSKALKLIQDSDKLTASYSQLAIPEHYFYYSLIILENYADFNEEEKKRYWDVLRSNHQKLASLAKDCPINFLDKNLIIEAQMAGISGNYIKAGALYDDAIKAARDNGFVQNEAIANEMAAKYFLTRNKITIASAYIRKACRAYIKWGASAKIKQLEKYYPMLLKKRRRFDDAIKHPDNPEAVSVFTDLSTIVEASQKISKEVTLENKIEILLRMLLEDTTAEKGYFLIEKDNQLKIIAEGLKQNDIKITPLMIPLEEFERIAQSVVFYVIRTRKLISLDDASTDGMFAYNKYIKETNPKSIVCIPMVTNEKLNAILYLENSTSVGAFSPRLVDLLTILLSQVSISIENSLLYRSVLELTNQLNSSKETLEKRIQVLEQE